LIGRSQRRAEIGFTVAAIDQGEADGLSDLSLCVGLLGDTLKDIGVPHGDDSAKGEEVDVVGSKGNRNCA
jgi:hypothetical protein